MGPLGQQETFFPVGRDLNDETLLAQPFGDGMGGAGIVFDQKEFHR